MQAHQVKAVDKLSKIVVLTMTASHQEAENYNNKNEKNKRKKKSAYCGDKLCNVIFSNLIHSNITTLGKKN